MVYFVNLNEIKKEVRGVCCELPSLFIEVNGLYNRKKSMNDYFVFDPFASAEWLSPELYSERVAC